MATAAPKHLPKYVRLSHGRYFYVRWNPVEKKVIWSDLGTNYAEMLSRLAERERIASGTLHTVFERYRREVSSKQSPNTRRQREWMLDVLNMSFGKMHPDDVTTRLVYRFLDEYSTGTETRKGAPVSANRLVSLLGRVYVKAIHWGDAENNPCRDMEKNKESPRRRTPADDEYNLVLGELEGVHSRAYRLLYLGGQRVMDSLKLPWPSVKPNGEVHVTQNKTGTLVIIESSPELAALIAECRAQPVLGQTVIADEKGQSLTYWQYANHVRRVKQRLMAEGRLASYFTNHDLRRKVGSEISPDNDILGHIDQRTRQRVYDTRPKRGKPIR